MTKKSPYETDIFNTVEAAHFLRAHVETIRRLARKGEIPAFKIGKDWRFRREALLHWAKTHHPRPKSPSVLVVDDDPSLVKVIIGALEETGWKISMDSTSNGYDALVRIGAAVPDLLILDVIMPEMNGKEVLRSLKRREKTKNMKVLVLTG